MPRPVLPKVITANALLSGHAVWLTPDDRWSADITEAEVFHDEAVAEDRLIFAGARQSEIAGAYLADIEPDGVAKAPAHLRERIRVSGPSSRVLPHR